MIYPCLAKVVSHLVKSYAVRLFVIIANWHRRFLWGMHQKQTRLREHQSLTSVTGGYNSMGWRSLPAWLCMRCLSTFRLSRLTYIGPLFNSVLFLKKYILLASPFILRLAFFFHRKPSSWSVRRLDNSCFQQKWRVTCKSRMEKRTA